MTSPEVGPLFGALVAEALDREWDRCGRPSEFTFIDAGAGPGTLARSVRAASPRCSDALEYVCVETSAAQRVLHPDWVTSVESLPAGSAGGVVIANELLDNIPFAPMEFFDDSWWSTDVDVSGDKLVRVRGARVGDVPGSVDVDVERFIHQPLAAAWLSDALVALRVGRVIVIDYCRDQNVDVEVRTYASHGRGAGPLVVLGAQDITVDVDVGQLQAATRQGDVLSTQADWLRSLGIDALVEQGRAEWERNAGVGDLAALKARSRVREADALLDPTGLGGFTVIEWQID